MCAALAALAAAAGNRGSATLSPRTFITIYYPPEKSSNDHNLWFFTRLKRCFRAKTFNLLRADRSCMEAIVPRRDDSAFEGCKKGALNFCQESDFKMRAVDDIISGESGTRRALARARAIHQTGWDD
jgi:hypothetical protein